MSGPWTKYQTPAPAGPWTKYQQPGAEATAAVKEDGVSVSPDGMVYKADGTSPAMPGQSAGKGVDPATGKPYPEAPFDAMRLAGNATGGFNQGLKNVVLGPGNLLRRGLDAL
ncbi:MAG: hypothetical protein K2X91_08565, partial [Thermoleophilia bacterium]|nr:hypothetical protein [Thermoleophilia bacterium]